MKLNPYKKMYKYLVRCIYFNCEVAGSKNGQGELSEEAFYERFQFSKRKMQAF